MGVRLDMRMGRLHMMMMMMVMTEKSVFVGYMIATMIVLVTLHTFV